MKNEVTVEKENESYTELYPQFSYRKIGDLKCEKTNYSGGRIDSTIENNIIYTAFDGLAASEMCPNFIIIKRHNMPNKGTLRGYKFHILILDLENSDNLEKGWNIAKDILIKNHVCSFKVFKNSSRPLFREDKEQCSKAITVYAFKENRETKEWKKIFEELNSTLTKYNITPAKLPGSDTLTCGTPYIAWENDSRDKSLKNPFEGIIFNSKHNLKSQNEFNVKNENNNINTSSINSSQNIRFIINENNLRNNQQLSDTNHKCCCFL